MTTHALIAVTDLAELREGLMRQSQQIERLTKAVESVQMQPVPEWVSINDYAARMGVSADTVRRRVKTGQIEARGSGKLRQVRLD